MHACVCICAYMYLYACIYAITGPLVFYIAFIHLHWHWDTLSCIQFVPLVHTFASILVFISSTLYFLLYFCISCIFHCCWAALTMNFPFMGLIKFFIYVKYVLIIFTIKVWSHSHRPFLFPDHIQNDPFMTLTYSGVFGIPRRSTD